MTSDDNKTMHEWINYKHLVNASDDAVYAFYNRRGMTSPQTKNEEYNVDSVAVETEQELLTRGSEFVKLALARYSRNGAVLDQLFSRAIDRDIGINCAALNNTGIFSDFIFAESEIGKVISVSDESEIFSRDWVGKATNVEIRALLTNRAFKLRYILGFFEERGGKPSVFSGLPEDKQQEVVLSLSSANFIATPPEATSDGYTDYENSKSYELLVALAGSVPLTIPWAACLDRLLRNFPRTTNYFKKLDLDLDFRQNLAQRWKTSDLEHECVESLRARILSLSGWHEKAQIVEFLASDDSSMRKAVYLSARLKIEHCQIALDKDGIVFLETYQENPWFTADSALVSKICDLPEYSYTLEKENEAHHWDAPWLNRLSSEYEDKVESQSKPEEQISGFNSIWEKKITDALSLLETTDARVREIQKKLNNWESSAVLIGLVLIIGTVVKAFWGWIE